MRTLTLLAALLLPNLSHAWPAAVGDPDAPVRADVVIRGATIYDGTGSPGIVGDVAIRDDKVVAVGKFAVEGKPRVLDATGLILCPGFIDLHTHSDRSLLVSPTNQNLNYLRQGVTTVVTGNCGSGPVDVAKYFAGLEKAGIGSNVVHQVPHNSLREQVMGNADRAPTDKELGRMKGLVDKGMGDGAVGMSTGLIYTPGSYAKTDELVELAKVVAAHGGLYASHIRSEGGEVLVAVAEVLEIARRAGIRVHISHIKVSGHKSWGLAPDVIRTLRNARSEGVAVTADQYPYRASSTSLEATLISPRWRTGTAKEMIARLDDPELGPRIRADILRQLEGTPASGIRIASYKKNPSFQGKDLETIAAGQKKSVLDMVLDIQRHGGASVVNFSMNPEEVRLFMKEDWVATASDGSAQVPNDTKPHPRSYGCFPCKIGRFAIEDRVIPLEQAVRSASGLPADILKLPLRGYVKAGCYADLVVFDPKTFRDRATFDDPHQYSTGVVHLFVNGQQAIADGEYDGKLAGRVIRFGGKGGQGE